MLLVSAVPVAEQLEAAFWQKTLLTAALLSMARDLSIDDLHIAPMGTKGSGKRRARPEDNQIHPARTLPDPIVGDSRVGKKACGPGGGGNGSCGRS